jgi:hypothetical protein
MGKIMIRVRLASVSSPVPSVRDRRQSDAFPQVRAYVDLHSASAPDGLDRFAEYQAQRRPGPPHSGQVNRTRKEASSGDVNPRKPPFRAPVATGRGALPGRRPHQSWP